MEASLLVKVVRPLILTSQVAAEYIAPANRKIGGGLNVFNLNDDYVAFVNLYGSREVISCGCRNWLGLDRCDTRHTGAKRANTSIF